MQAERSFPQRRRSGRSPGPRLAGRRTARPPGKAVVPCASGTQFPCDPAPPLLGVALREASACRVPATACVDTFATLACTARRSPSRCTHADPVVTGDWNVPQTQDLGQKRHKAEGASLDGQGPCGAAYMPSSKAPARSAGRDRAAGGAVFSLAGVTRGSVCLSKLTEV